MNVLRITMSGRAARHAAIRRNVPFRIRGPFHQLQDSRACMLERHIEIGHDAAGGRIIGHQFDDVVDVRIRIDVMQAHPGTVRAGHDIEGALRAPPFAFSAGGLARTPCGT
jgi:hypothetical protein